jgi:hypothetical protein
MPKGERWQEICKKTGKCDRCPPHDGENRGRRAKKAKPKPPRETIRKRKDGREG